MARRYALKPASSWSQTGPLTRLTIGVMCIAAVGYYGLTPKSLFGLKLIWPYAALWGAVGWGRSGLALAPMIVLTLFGLAQDVTFAAPLGCFVLVNLVAYGTSALAAEHFDVDNDPLVRFLSAPLVMAAGFLALWILASNTANRAVSIGPLFTAYLVTVLSYMALAGIFKLGARRSSRQRHVL